MVNLFEAVLLGLVQGITEWFPISSSGHLVIVQQLLGIRVPLLFDVMLHGGTLLAVFAFFWKDILKILSAALRMDFESDDGKLAVLILLAAVPIALIGIFFYDLITPLFNSIFVIGVALLATGCMLYATKFFRNWQELNPKNALFIGISQAFSLVPGISRSGITISSAVFRGIDKQQAFTFSFLLAIPTIIGANAFELYRATILDLSIINFEMIAGTAIAAVVGYFSLKLLRDVLEKGKFYFFAYYCWILGTSILAYRYLSL
jgi:undecaprenyl-diphosphatase